MSSQSLYEVLVPASSPGKRFSYEHHKKWDEFVREVSGGLTVLRGVKGEWVGPTGTLFVDRMIPVRVICTEEEIEEIINFTITHYDQEAVLAYKLSDTVLLRKKNKEN